ncbi:MAG: hypothetical protein FWC79_01795 [Oscillospiraceae bacterium]|nr:hypothetical protein [Oscillospiraceae bacterium]
MSPLELTTSITALANLIACSVQNEDTVDLLAAAFTQLGDTLATISVQRSLSDKANTSGILEKGDGIIAHK